MIYVPRAESDSTSPLANGFYDGVDDLVREADAVFNAPAILICAVVGHILKERVDKITFGRMDFDCKFR